MIISALAPAWAGSWNPSKLFFGTRDGLWWDFSAGGHLYQDHLRTLPLTSDGQAIGGIFDKSGKSRHAYQATSGQRPIWRSAGYAEFDGTDDVLPLQSAMSAYTSSTIIIIGNARAGFTNGGRLGGRSSGRSLWCSTTGPSFRYSNNEAATSIDLTDNCETKSALTIVYNNQSMANTWVNNTLRGGSPFDPANDVSTEFQVGAANAAGSTFPGAVNIHQAFFISTPLDTAERVRVLKYLGALAGLSL